MKKVVLIVVLILLPAMFFGQSVLDKFDDHDDVTSVIVTKKMFELISLLAVDTSDKEALEYQELIKKVDNLKLYSTTSKRASSEMKTAYGKYMKSAGLVELVRINENGSSVKIAGKSATEQNKLKELLMFMEGSSDEDPTILLSLTGSFDLNEISTITAKMKIPGGEELKGATKQKL